MESNQTITQLFDKEDYSEIRAETLWTRYVVDHNMLFTGSDDFINSQDVPCDSKVATQFSLCRCTKIKIA